MNGTAFIALLLLLLTLAGAQASSFTPAALTFSPPTCAGHPPSAINNCISTSALRNHNSNADTRITRVTRKHTHSRMALYLSTTAAPPSHPSHDPAAARGSARIALMKRNIFKKFVQRVRNVGNKIKEGVQKAGKWIKEKALPAIKNKVLPIVDKVAAGIQKAVKFIPVVGTAASVAIGGVRAAVNAPKYADMAKEAKKLESQGRKAEANRLRGQIGANVAANSGIPIVSTAGKVVEKGLQVKQKVDKAKAAVKQAAARPGGIIPGIRGIKSAAAARPALSKAVPARAGRVVAKIASGAKAAAAAVVGARPGVKPGATIGAKLGAKLAAMPGAKLGAKPGAKPGV
ncbi:hypothetical protein GQ42DRAFT_160060, partial [Ramicandelaber brevisporus]